MLMLALDVYGIIYVRVDFDGDVGVDDYVNVDERADDAFEVYRVDVNVGVGVDHFDVDVVFGCWALGVDVGVAVGVYLEGDVELYDYVFLLNFICMMLFQLLLMLMVTEMAFMVTLT